MSTIRDIKSELTQKAFNALCTKYHIPACVHPTLTGPNQNVLQSPDGKIGVYTWFFDFANYQIPLSQFLVDALGHFGIHLSQLSYNKGWMSFVKHYDERETAEGEAKQITLTEGRVVPLDPPASSASGNSSDSIHKLFDKGNDAGQEHSIERDDEFWNKLLLRMFQRVLVFRVELTEPLVVASVTPTPDGGYDGPTDSMSELNLQTRPPAVRYVVSSDDSHHSGSRFKVNSFSRSSVADAPVMTVAITTNVVTDVSTVLVPKLNEPADSSDTFYDLQDLDSDTLHHIYVPKWKLYIEFNVGAARQVCLGAKVRMRAEHTLEQKDRFEDKCAEQVALLSEKDAEIAHLRSLLCLKEAEDLLRDELSSKKSSLESVFKIFKGRVEAIQDEQETILTIGCAINKGIRDGLKAGVDHQKAGKDLSVIKAYDPSAEAKYVDVVNALRTVDFPLLSELKSKKDASMVDLMDSLSLEGPLAEIPGVEDLQPSLEQLMLPIHKAEDNIIVKHLSLTNVMVPLVEPLSSHSLIGEASTSATPITAEPITTLSITFASFGVVLPLFVSDYQVSNVEPHDEDPLTTNFEEKELDTIPKSAVVS
nr:hypothetical protein [Tanacetum cinerariifolium]